MSNCKPSLIHIFAFKLGIQLSQDAVFTRFYDEIILSHLHLLQALPL